VRVGVALGGMEATVADARWAEEAGFDDVTCGEHLFFHGPVPNAFVALAAAAGATGRVGLISTVSLAPLYPPALFAKMAATLDVVSGGRVELGLGAGGENPSEFHAAGVDPADRFRRLEETVEVMRRLFRGDAVDFTGSWTTLEGTKLEPLPARPGGPPLWMVGRKPGPLRRAGRLADVWLPYMISAERFAIGLGEVRAAAAEAGRPEEAVDGAVFAWTCADPDGDWAREQGTAMVSSIYQQDFAPLADRYLFLGTPEDVAERVRAYADAGAGRIVLSVAAGREHRPRVLDTLAGAVLPLLHQI
jgi:probable F420-dependent oxidoreductase